MATAEAKRVSRGVIQAGQRPSGGPSIGMTTAPPQETPVKEPPMQEAPVAGPSCPDTPAPMKMGGAGDGQTWAEWVETSAEAKFQWARPLKHPHSQSKEMGDWAETSLSPPRCGGETRLHWEALRVCGGAAVTSG